MADDPGALFGGEQTPAPAPAGDESTGTGEAKDSLAKFNGADGKRDYAKLEKSYLELESSHGRLMTEKQTREREAQEGVPKAAADYGLDFDWDGLKEQAGRAYTEGKMEHPDAADFFAAAHRAGVSKTQAQGLFSGYMTAKHGRMPEVQTLEQRRAAAITAIPNGNLVWQDVRAALADQSKVREFSADEQARIEELAADPAGLALMHRLVRGTASAAPPNARPAPPVNKAEEARRIWKLYDDLSDPEKAADAEREIHRLMGRYFPDGVLPEETLAA